MMLITTKVFILITLVLAGLGIFVQIVTAEIDKNKDNR
ncbi:hypothetical protein IGI43_003288 [Enterococcus sp. AZ126]